MLISLQLFRQRLKSLGLPVFRNKAPTGTPYPYFVYTFTNKNKVTASGQQLVFLPEYQVSLFTTGNESELKPFERVFKDTPYATFSSQQGDENNDTVTNFYTFVRVLDDE